MPLHIRKMRKNDLEPMYQLLSDPAVMKYLEPPFTKEKTESFLNTCGLTTNPRIYAVDNEEGFTGYVIFHEYDEDTCRQRKPLLLNAIRNRLFQVILPKNTDLYIKAEKTDWIYIDEMHN